MWTGADGGGAWTGGGSNRGGAGAGDGCVRTGAVRTPSCPEGGGVLAGPWLGPRTGTVRDGLVGTTITVEEPAVGGFAGADVGGRYTGVLLGAGPDGMRPIAPPPCTGTPGEDRS